MMINDNYDYHTKFENGKKIHYSDDELYTFSIDCFKDNSKLIYNMVNLHTLYGLSDKIKVSDISFTRSKDNKSYILKFYYYIEDVNGRLHGFNNGRLEFDNKNISMNDIYSCSICDIIVSFLTNKMKEFYHNMEICNIIIREVKSNLKDKERYKQEEIYNIVKQFKSYNNMNFDNFIIKQFMLFYNNKRYICKTSIDIEDRSILDIFYNENINKVRFDTKNNNSFAILVYLRYYMKLYQPSNRDIIIDEIVIQENDNKEYNIILKCHTIKLLMRDDYNLLFETDWFKFSDNMEMLIYDILDEKMYDYE